MSSPRLFLIAPTEIIENSFAARLEDILSKNNVAILLLAANSGAATGQFSSYHQIIEITHQHNISVLIQNDLKLVKKFAADGVQIDSVKNLKQTLKESKRPEIIGAAGIVTKHDAMVKGELQTDYVFFGDCCKLEDDFSEPKILELAAWWAENFKVPGVALAGKKLESVREVAATGIDFVAVRSAIWNFPGDPSTAIKTACEILSEFEVRT